MAVTISILRNELAEKGHLVSYLRALSRSMEIVEDRYLIVPHVGGLHRLLMFLKEKDVEYQTHFDKSESL
jgi:hypothetical protein